MKATTWTGYRTGYLSTSSGAPKILVMNLATNQGKHQAFDYEVGGGEAQHLHAVTQTVPGGMVRVERCGQWKSGYYFAVETTEEEA